MDLLPKDLLYECLYFLRWDEYYDVCKHMNIALRFDIYLRNNQAKMDIDYICNQVCEYLEIVKCLHSMNARCTEWAIHMACYYGHLETVKFLVSVGAPYTMYAMNWASESGHLEVVKFLHSINAPYTDYAMDRASWYGHLEVVKFLYSINAPYSHIYALWIAKGNKHFEVVKFLESIKKD